MKIWKFKTRNFLVTVSTEDEPFDSLHIEPELAQECRTKIRSGEWKCFTVIVTVKHRRTDVELANEYLGQCIYADRREFRDHVGIKEKGRRDGCNYGSYFSQMVRDACLNARAELRRLRKAAADAEIKLSEGKVRPA